MTKNDKGEIEIDLLQLFRAMWRNALVIILLAIIGGGIAFGISYLFITPKYEAAATMYVNNSTVSVGSTSFSISSGELSAAQTLVNTYIQILKSRTTLEEVLEESGVTVTPSGEPYSTELLGSMIRAAAVKNTGIFEITVTSESPTEAELLANTIAKVLPDRISDIVDGSAVRVVDYAIVPAHRSSPSYTRNTAIGGALGFVLIAGIICLREIFGAAEDVLIHSSDDVAKLYPDIPVLAIIPDMRTPSKKSYYSDYTSYYGSSERKAK